VGAHAQGRAAARGGAAGAAAVRGLPEPGPARAHRGRRSAGGAGVLGRWARGRRPGWTAASGQIRGRAPRRRCRELRGRADMVQGRAIRRLSVSSVGRLPS
jgi:hypothetical protein